MTWKNTMNLYNPEQIASIHQEKFAFLEIEEADHILTIRLDRADKKNALHPQMVNELGFAFQYAHDEKNVRVVIIEAKGNVFCAGADLKAMMGVKEPNDSTIPAPNEAILFGELFNKVHKPTIAKVAGNVYAGGFLFLAGCNYVVAVDGLKFGLPEVKRGLFPMQVMAALLQVMPARKVLDWCMRGYDLSVEKAADWGLVTHIATAETLDQQVQAIAGDLKENSPTAIRMGLQAFDHIRPQAQEHTYLSAMLIKTLQSKDGQEGLMAFREKRKPEWTGE